MKLEVRIKDGISIIPLISEPGINSSATVIAKGISLVLDYQLKDIAELEKEQFAKDYLRKIGWKVEN